MVVAAAMIAAALGALAWQVARNARPTDDGGGLALLQQRLA